MRLSTMFGHKTLYFGKLAAEEKNLTVGSRSVTFHDLEGLVEVHEKFMWDQAHGRKVKSGSLML